MEKMVFADQLKASWNMLEQFYDELLSHSGWEWVEPMRGLIRDLRARGYDQKLRAGHSVYICLLSRSREHGLRPEQPLIAIEPRRNGQMIVEYQSQSSKETATLDQIMFCAELEHFLDQLLAQDID